MLTSKGVRFKHMTNRDFFTTLAELTGLNKYMNDQLYFPAVWKEHGDDAPTLFISVPYWQFMRDEYHSGGKYFEVDKFSKAPPAPKYHKKVGLTPYHLEDSVDTHQVAVFLSFLQKLKEDSEERLLPEEPVLEENYLTYAVLIAARLHDVGKVISRTLKKRGTGEDVKYYFSYAGHNISGFNLLRHTLTHRRLQKFFPHFSENTIGKVRLAILLFVYLHQRSDVSNNAVRALFPIIKYITNDGKPELLEFFINALNSFAIADREGSFSLGKKESEPYVTPTMGDYFPHNTSTFLYTDQTSKVFERIFELSGKNKPLFVVPIGAPGVGKTTFAKGLTTYMQMNGKWVGVVSYDVIRFEMFSDAFPELVGTMSQSEFYKRAHVYAQNHLDELNNRYNARITKLIEDKVDIIYVDNTNVSKSSRNRATNRSQPRNTVEIFFDARLGMHLKQNRERADKTVPELHLFRMYTHTMLPTVTKGKPALHTIWLVKTINNAN